MEGADNRGDANGGIVKTSSRSVKATSSGRLTPRNSPTHLRGNSLKTPRKETRGRTSLFRWLRSRWLLPWLLIVAIWATVGFHVQSKWANREDKNRFLGYEEGNVNHSVDDAYTNFNNFNGTVIRQEFDLKRDSNASLKDGRFVEDLSQDGLSSNSLDRISKDVKRKAKSVFESAKSVLSRNQRRKRTKRSMSQNKRKGVESEKLQQNERTDSSDELSAVGVDEIHKKNTSYGLIVGPFGKIEDGILEWSPDKRSGTCDRKGMFAKAVWSRSFVLILHELSMTGAPLSMMELASEILSCGGTVSVVALSRKGGLLGELSKRGIKVLKDKAEFSFKTASKADLVIAGSAVCDYWIEQYLSHYIGAGNQIIWWIMENRRPYFDRAKRMLDKVKLLMFLSQVQSEQWKKWCQDEKVQLKSDPELVPLSVNDEVAFVAGIPSSLNTLYLTTDKMLEKKDLLRRAVREEMGLNDTDMLVVSLSSINPGKGQFLLLESALLVVQKDKSSELDSSRRGGSIKNLINKTNTGHLLRGNKKQRSLQGSSDRSTKNEKVENISNDSEKASVSSLTGPDIVDSNMATHFSDRYIRKILLEDNEVQHGILKVLIGSLGSKSNKVIYVKAMLKFLSQNPELSKRVLWTPSTTRVASLYAAADVYVINAQGLGETFGRVTVEAMAFGLPILGTEAGGTVEIVEHNVTGLLHPLGRRGNRVLADNIRFLLHNPSVRAKMGETGRTKVRKMYLKKHMYKRFAEVLRKSMKIK